jgi:ATP-dependent DNA helicase RecG
MRPEALFPFFADIGTLSGVGPKTVPLMERIAGGPRVLDLLLTAPLRFEDRRLVPGIEGLAPGTMISVQGVIGQHRMGAGRAPYTVPLVGEAGEVSLTFFRPNPRWLQAQFPTGETRCVSGVLQWFNDRAQIVHPDHVWKPGEANAPPDFEPIYPLTAGLTQVRIRKAIEDALSRQVDLPEWLDPALISREKWPGFIAALHTLHTGPDPYDASYLRASQRLAYDEALGREQRLSRARTERALRPALPVAFDASTQARLIAALPFTPTAAQIRAAGEIAKDMGSESAMARMLQGDVGAGKTLVAAFAAAQAAKAGLQTAMMAPTEILARQHAEALDGFLGPLGLRVIALTGRDKGRAREGLRLQIAEGQAHVICGTQALFQRDVQFKRLGMLVIDEQHRFGVSDRLRLAAKGIEPHMLVMTATPIPRSIALSMYGHLSLSILDEKPAGRLPIDTRAVPDTRLDEIVSAIGRATARDERVFWVCPALDADALGDSTATARADAMKEQLAAPIGLVHGQMKPEEKDQALEAFRRGDTKVLVATTVVEVGVDVPDATIMVIERAERFGLAQLHQLRGRVGRGKKPSYCILLYQPPLSETAKERLSVLRETEDGFVIAETDFKLRGPGELLGVRQSGLEAFRFLEIRRDAGLLAMAGKDSRAALGLPADHPRHAALGMLDALFGGEADEMLTRSG